MARDCRMESAAPALSAIAPSRIHARLLLGAFVLAAGFFVAVTLSPLARGFADVDRGPGDLGLYSAEVDRMAPDNRTTTPRRRN